MTTESSKTQFNALLEGSGNVLYNISLHADCAFLSDVSRELAATQEMVMGLAVEALQETRKSQVFENTRGLRGTDINDKFLELKDRITDAQLQEIMTNIRGRPCYVHLEKMQEVGDQNEIDHALIALWRQIAPEGREDLTAEDVRKWMANDASRFHLNLIRKVELIGQDLKCIPPEIQYLRRLLVLNLSNNQIGFIPPEIRHLRHLVMLDFTNNQIEVIPSQIASLRKLGGLFLGENQIRVIPEAIMQLRELWWLYLNKNQIEVIPPELEQMDTFVLDVSDNPGTS